MKKLELQKMEKLLAGGPYTNTYDQEAPDPYDEGGGGCTKIMNRGDFSRSDACIVCSGIGGIAVGAMFGGGAGALQGWIGGVVQGLFTC
ncbi:hypothetical protein [Flavobacterium sp. YO12]|uniref:hypothetical protein n=1 Tax=unclassified Flavobacterium TaxID=196869 RepID=UPI0010255621|nr:hypothetical protein [Flavobacterium sp. YO12]RXM47040.1 hypothetical protein BOW55_13455 [Flavobacterium sp. YO12]